MPRHHPRPLPPVEAILAGLDEAGVVGAPREGPSGDLAGLLFIAAHLVEREKTLDFSGFSWDDPGFVAVDRKARVDVRYARFDGATRDELARTLAANLPRLRGPTSLLALGCSASPVKEFELEHHAYGEVTLFEFRHRPAESADPRLHAARDAGWTPTLKAHNLLPGRGIVVLDEHQGVLLTEPGMERLHGLLVLLNTSDVHMWWNPIAQGVDPEMQYWLSWGPGRAASEWREVLRYEGEE